MKFSLNDNGQVTRERYIEVLREANEYRDKYGSAMESKLSIYKDLVGKKKNFFNEYTF